MNKTHRNEFYAVTVMFLLFLALVDTVIIKRSLTKTLNGEHYSEAGMMEYTNPKDNRTLYLPIYEKVNK